MRVGQRKSGGAVIKHSRGPGSDRVAGGASRCCGRESSRDVIRNISANRCGALEYRRVASIAIRRVQRVVVVYVAGSAGCRHWRRVSSDQRKSGHAVIERSGVPTRRGVASGAVGCRESSSRSGVHRIVGSLPVGQVALRIAAIGGGDR